MVKNKLIKYVSREADIFYSLSNPDYSKVKGGDLEFIVSNIIYYFLKNSIQKEIVELYSNKIGLNRKAILSAHGSSLDGFWVYYIDKEPYYVQDWIDKYDGKYSPLIIHSCNSGGFDVFSEKSAVLFYDRDYSFQNQIRDEGRIELYIPRIGCIDSYTEEYYLNEMRKS